MDNPRNQFTISTILQMLVFIVLVPFLPLLISWNWSWWQAWVYALIGIFGFVLSRALVARRHPDLLAERAKFMQHEDIKPWDSILARLVGLGGGLIPLVARLQGIHAEDALSLAAGGVVEIDPKGFPLRDNVETL